VNWRETRERLIGCGVNAARLPEIWRAKIDLSGVSLRGANLSCAYLRGANLSEADLHGTFLSFAILNEANLRNTNLGVAYLRGAILRDANLSGADLSCTTLRGALLHGADLSGIKTNHLTIGIHEAPEGALIGWGKKSGHIVKMLIPAGAPRSCGTTRKYRAAWVETLEIENGVTRLEHQTDYGTGTYEVGAITRADSWDEDRWTECSHGIHFFLTREEAEAWG